MTNTTSYYTSVLKYASIYILPLKGGWDVATVKQKLSDIEKALQRSQKNNAQLIKDCNDKINYYLDLLSISGLTENTKTRYKRELNEYTELKRELENKVTYEKQKQELQAIKFDEQIKRQDIKLVTDYFSKILNGYFTEYDTQKLRVLELLENSEVIKDEIKHAKKVFGDLLDDTDYLKAYSNAKKIVVSLYKGDIKSLEKAQKSELQAKNNALKRKILKRANVSATCIGLVALSRHLKSKRR